MVKRALLAAQKGDGEKLITGFFFQTDDSRWDREQDEQAARENQMLADAAYREQKGRQWLAEEAWRARNQLVQQEWRAREQLVEQCLR